MEVSRVEKVLQHLGLTPGPYPPRLKPRLPATAVQIAPERVSVVRLAPPASRKGSENRPLLAAFREVDLPRGAVVPSLTRPNLPDPESLVGALRAALAGAAPRETRVSVVLPDSAARVSILKFSRMPATRREVLDLVRFRMQKVLPFRTEEATLDYQLLSDAAAEETEFLVALIQRPVLWQYERLLTGRGCLPGLVDLESFNLANLAAMGGEGVGGAGDRALVNVAAEYLTVLFFRNGALNFYRCKQLAEEERGAPDRSHPALRRELASCAAFYREHLFGSALAEATLRAVEEDPRLVLQLAREELACPVRMLDPGRAVTLPAGADPQDPTWQRLAPAVGAALGRRA